MILILIIVSAVGYFWLKSAFKVFDLGAYNDNKGGTKYESDN